MRRLPIVQLSTLTCVAALAFVPAASADDLGGPYGRDAGAPPAIDQRVPDAPATALRAAVNPADHRVPDAPGTALRVIANPADHRVPDAPGTALRVIASPADQRVPDAPTTALHPAGGPTSLRVPDAPVSALRTAPEPTRPVFGGRLAPVPGAGERNATSDINSGVAAIGAGAIVLALGGGFVLITANRRRQRRTTGVSTLTG